MHAGVRTFRATNNIDGAKSTTRAATGLRSYGCAAPEVCRSELGHPPRHRAMACDKCCRHVRAMPPRAPHVNGVCSLGQIAAAGSLPSRGRGPARPGRTLALPPPSGLVLTPLRAAAAADHRVPALPRPHSRRRVYRHRADRATGLANHRHRGVAALCGGGRAAGVHHVPQVRRPPAAVHPPPPARREPSRVRSCAACAAPAPRNAAPAASRCRCRSCCSSACWSAVRPRPLAPLAFPACPCPARGRRAPTNAHADARIAALALAILLDWSQVEKILDKEIGRMDNASSVSRPALSARAARARGAPTSADARELLGRPLASW